MALAAIAGGAGSVWGQGPPPTEILCIDDGNGGCNTDNLGENPRLPGDWPGAITGANWNWSTPPGGVLDGPGSNYLILGQPFATGPNPWTTGWMNEGDFDANIGPAEPARDASYPFDSVWQSFRSDIGDPNSGNYGRLELQSGPPTYSWSIHPGKGVVIMSVRNNGRDNQNTFSGQPIGTLYAHAHPVAGDFRSGPAYSMLFGDHRNGHGTMYLSMNYVGLAEEAIIDCSSVWFPYEQGWIGGYTTTRDYVYYDVPNFDELADYGFDFGDLYTQIVFPQTNGEFAGSALTDDVGADFRGQVTLGGGTYTFYTLSDDGSYLDIMIDGEWKTVVYNGGYHGSVEKSGTITLGAGTYDVRVRYVEGGGDCELQVFAEGADLGAKGPLTFDGAGASVTYYGLPSSRANDTDGVWLATISATPGLPSSVVTWEGSFEGRGRIELPSGTDPDNGMLFGIQTNDSNDGKLFSVIPDSAGWDFGLRSDSDLDDSGNTYAFIDNSSFAFVYVGDDYPRLIGGYIDGATGSSIKGSGNYSLVRTAAGVYELTMPGKTGDDGCLVLQVADTIPGQNDRPARTFLNYEYNSDTGVFEINSRQLVFGDNLFGEDCELTDSSFYFTWIDFTNPVTPVCAAADANADGVVDTRDVLEFLNKWNSNDAFADLNADNTVDTRDVLAFLNIWNSCR